MWSVGPLNWLMAKSEAYASDPAATIIFCSRARVTKLVDVADLKSAAARCMGSIPIPGTSGGDEEMNSHEAFAIDGRPKRGVGQRIMEARPGVEPG